MYSAWSAFGNSYFDTAASLFLCNIDQLMCLQTEPPFRMLLDIVHYFHCIPAGTGLKEMVFGGQLDVRGQVLSQINNLDFIHMIDFERCSLFRRTGHPVDSFRQRTCTVRFYTYIFTRFVKHVDKCIVDP